MYFGTDGIRGEYGKDISPALAFKCGCSIANLCTRKKVIIGKDTRTSRDVLALSVANGLLSRGVDVIDVGITPTPVISYLTSTLNCDYGIVISASHNPPNNNGIKIFGNDGYKIGEDEEEKIEGQFSFSNYSSFDKLGFYHFRPQLVNLYKKHIFENCSSFGKNKIVIDCANGATSSLAKQVFKKLGANVTILNCAKNGLQINENCGALHPEIMAKEVIKQGADIGFAFDGDGDRIIACDEKGNLIDGDDILCILSQSIGKNEKYIVGTSMTNKGLENYLVQNGITLLRADVGDKYVAEKMKEKNILLGGEPSGHIIIKSFSKTGDAIFTACALTNIIAKKNSQLSTLVPYTKFPQININVPVQDKFRIINSEILSQQILAIQKQFKNKGRAIVRASGTENKIRIMVEHIDKQIALEKANELKLMIEKIK